MKILSISSPGGNRGPAIGYLNHVKALNSNGFELVEIDKNIWENQHLMKTFDVAWAYVRFQPDIYQRCIDLGIPIVGGPNIALERADIGVTDDWEKWYLTKSKVSINFNVADYYSKRVSEFVTSDLKCKTLEYCYENSEISQMSNTKKVNDVLIYFKHRVNDNNSYSRLKALEKGISDAGLSYKTIKYGNYSRKDYLEMCSSSRVCAWLSIEDYCSLAQIEAHLTGCCVIGTSFNLTIPVINEAITNEAQKLNKWIEWESDKNVVNGYLNSIVNVLSINDLDNIVLDSVKQRHSYEYYRNITLQHLSEVLR